MSGSYVVHNNFVYKSSSPVSLPYALVLIAAACVFYYKLWPTVKGMMKEGLSTTVSHW